MKLHTCCFTGHRKIDKPALEKIEEKLYCEIETLIHSGVKYFGCGGALGFDTLAAKTVLSLKKDFSDIRLILVLPCKNQDRYWEKKDQKIFRNILLQTDQIVYTSDCYTQDCMFIRNRHLVDYSHYCICYLNGQRGGTAFTVNYARKKGLQIIHLAD